MHVLLATLGTAGDVHPFVAIGEALRNRGHAVTLAVNAHFAPTVRAAGLDFVSLGPAEDYLEVVRSPAFFGPGIGGFRLMVERLVVPSFRPLYEAAAACPRGETVGVGSIFAAGLRLARETLGLPLATVYLQPTLLPTVYDIPVIPGWVPAGVKRAGRRAMDVFFDGLLARPLNRFRAELGFKPVRGVWRGWLPSPERIIGMFPDWYAPRQPDWPPQARLTGFPLYDAGRGEPLPEEVEAFLRAGDPPVVFTAGTGMAHAGRFFAESAAACGLLGRRALLLTPHRAQLPEALPAGVGHFDYVPLGPLLPRAAALVHHGGIGTLSQGFAAGVPQLIVPLAFDQPDSAVRARRLGVGDSIPPGSYRAAAVARKLGGLLGSPEVAARCDAVRKRLAGADALAETCTLIEGLAPGA